MDISQYVQEVLQEPSTANCRVSSAVLELSRVPSTANARVCQAVIEVILLPTLPNARVSQAVIELPNAFGSQTGAGLYPEYVKRRNMVGH